MKTYCCNYCKKLIESDDIEAIEVKQPYSRMLFSKEEFRPIRTNEHDENQNIHYCGKCKNTFYDWV